MPPSQPDIGKSPSKMNTEVHDPVRRTAELICPESPDELEVRLKTDIFSSIGRIKPAVIAKVDFDTEVMSGQFFADLPAPLQGIAIARCEGALAFYNRVGWHKEYLTTELSICVPAEGIEPLSERYHAKTLHDLAYVHPKHFEKMLGKPGAASLWESLKRFSQYHTA